MLNCNVLVDQRLFIRSDGSIGRPVSKRNTLRSLVGTMPTIPTAKFSFGFYGLLKKIWRYARADASRNVFAES